jgi:hypothetical protein
MRWLGLAGIAALTVAADHNSDFVRFAWRLGRQFTVIVLARVCLVGLIARLHQFSANDLSSQIPDAGFGARSRRAGNAQRCKNKRSQTEPKHIFLPVGVPYRCILNASTTARQRPPARQVGAEFSSTAAGSAHRHHHEVPNLKKIGTTVTVHLFPAVHQHRRTGDDRFLARI